MAHTLKKQSGASLIEICITVVIIAVATLIIMAFSRNTLMMSQDARANDLAYFAAEQKIDSLANMVFATLPTNGSDGTTLDNFAFTRNWAVNKNGYIICATVTVKWQSLNGQKQLILAGAVN
jgi:Tfp pilus assembly protein PilV